MRVHVLLLDGRRGRSDVSSREERRRQQRRLLMELDAILAVTLGGTLSPVAASASPQRIGPLIIQTLHLHQSIDRRAPEVNLVVKAAVVFVVMLLHRRSSRALRQWSCGARSATRL